MVRSRAARAFGRCVVGTLALALALAPALALAQGAEVDIAAVRAPERTMAGVPFAVHVDLANHGTAERTVYLFAALYVGAGGPCGAATDPRFRAYTPLIQARIALAPGAEVSFPENDKDWLQRYQREHVPRGVTTNELCVFVAEDDAASAAQLRYLDYEAVPLSTRGENQPPLAGFSWTPETPIEAQDARFVASATDPEDDPVSFRWDFGHHNASGRAVAAGVEATHFFFPNGTFDVTLTATDGFNATTVVRRVTVLPEGPAPTSGTPPPGTSPTPLPLALSLGAAAWAALALRGRR